MDEHPLYNPFGEELARIMAEAGIADIQQLAALLAAQGWQGSVEDLREAMRHEPTDTMEA